MKTITWPKQFCWCYTQGSIKNVWHYTTWLAYRSLLDVADENTITTAGKTIKELVNILIAESKFSYRLVQREQYANKTR